MLGVNKLVCCLFTRKATVTTAADDILEYVCFFFFFFEREKIRLDISCETSARQRFHMNYQALFSEKDKN